MENTSKCTSEGGLGWSKAEGDVARARDRSAAIMSYSLFFHVMIVVELLWTALINSAGRASAEQDSLLIRISEPFGVSNLIVATVSTTASGAVLCPTDSDTLHA